jgi:hypothetical protein
VSIVCQLQFLKNVFAGARAQFGLVSTRPGRWSVSILDWNCSGFKTAARRRNSDSTLTWERLAAPCGKKVISRSSATGAGFDVAQFFHLLEVPAQSFAELQSSSK